MQHDRWIGTTFLEKLDYYNSKPPLNVWLIALSFKAFGTNLIALRIVSLVAAWLTVAVIVLWARRLFGPIVGLASGLVLATSFAFIHEHAGRSGNTDALFALLLVLVVVTLWAAWTRPWPALWLGPLLAAVFLLRGMGVLMPLLVVIGVVLLAGRSARATTLRLGPVAVALLLFLAPVGTWIVLRYRLDEWRFLSRLFWNDFVALSSRPLDGHVGGPLFYLNILQKHQFDWLLAGVAALLLFPVSWSTLRASLGKWRHDYVTVLLITGPAPLRAPTAGGPTGASRSQEQCGLFRGPLHRSR